MHSPVTADPKVIVRSTSSQGHRQEPVTHRDPGPVISRAERGQRWSFVRYIDLLLWLPQQEFGPLRRGESEGQIKVKGQVTLLRFCIFLLPTCVVETSHYSFLCVGHVIVTRIYDGNMSEKRRPCSILTMVCFCRSLTSWPTLQSPFQTASR